MLSPFSATRYFWKACQFMLAQRTDIAIKLFFRSCLLVSLWWALTDGAPESWYLGAPVIVLSLAASLHLQPWRQTIAWLRLPSFVAFFLWSSLKGGLGVALRAFHPRLPLNPGMIEIPLRLRDQADQIFLAALINLMPGTVSMGVDRNRLFLHALDTHLPVEKDVRNAEDQVAKLLGSNIS